MIFLDVDGVIADFTGAAAVLHGFDVEHWPLGTYNMEDVLRIADSEFWAPINAAGAEFWASLDLLPWARELIDALPCFTLLTSPSHYPSSAHGKVAWIQRIFGSDFRDYLIGSPKHLLASYPGAILIDDFAANCDRFSAAGGRAVLFPAQWNHRYRHHRDPLSVVLPELEDALNTGWETP